MTCWRTIDDFKRFFKLQKETDKIESSTNSWFNSCHYHFKDLSSQKDPDIIEVQSEKPPYEVVGDDDNETTRTAAEAEEETMQTNSNGVIVGPDDDDDDDGVAHHTISILHCGRLDYD